MNRPKRLDFEQTFAGGFDYEEALENYCDELERLLEGHNTLVEYSDDLLADNKELRTILDKAYRFVLGLQKEYNKELFDSKEQLIDWLAKEE